MSKLQWKDASSYSRGECGVVEPTTWELDLSGLRVAVHRLHGVDGLWFGSCHTMGISRHQLGADLEQSKREFIDYLIGRSQNWTKKLERTRAGKDAP